MMKLVAVALLAIGVTASPALAQGPVGPRKSRPPAVPPHLVMERLSRMSPSERDRLFGRLPQERRDAIEERLRKYSEMPPAMKKRLRDEYNLFQQLTPEKQEEMRKLFKQLGDFPEDRRAAIRRELVRLRNMPPERREKRMASPRFSEEYNEDERQFLSNLTELLARPPVAN